MKYIFVWFAFIAILSSCSTQNPLCTDNYCVEGEVFLRSELGDRDFSELNIDDSQLLSTLSGATVIESEQSSEYAIQILNTTVADITLNTSEGNTAYLGHIININATIAQNQSDPNDDTIFIANDNNVAFFLKSINEPDLLNTFMKGNSYTLHLYISNIYWSDIFDGYFLISHIIKDTTIEKVSIAELVSDAKNNNKYYQGRIVEVDAEISYISNTTGNIIGETNDHDVTFGLFLTPNDIRDSYQIGKSYTLLLFVSEIGDDVFLGPAIDSYYVNKQQ